MESNKLTKSITIDELKYALRQCSQNAECIKCPYYRAHDINYDCVDYLLKDSLHNLEQLERENKELRAKLSVDWREQHG